MNAVSIGIARLRVRVWHRVERFAERRLRRAYDRLVDVETTFAP